MLQPSGYRYVPQVGFECPAFRIVEKGAAHFSGELRFREGGCVSLQRLWPDVLFVPLESAQRFIYHIAGWLRIEHATHGLVGWHNFTRSSLAQRDHRLA